jgi:hypothetical protein
MCRGRAFLDFQDFAFELIAGADFHRALLVRKPLKRQ